MNQSHGFARLPLRALIMPATTVNPRLLQSMHKSRINHEQSKCHDVGKDIQRQSPTSKQKENWIIPQPASGVLAPSLI